MSTGSRIEWTDTTWNPTLGCDRVSEGCDNCYAISNTHRLAGNPNPKIAAPRAGLTVDTGTRIDWTGRIQLLHGRLGDPLRWRKPRRVFVNSLSDLFHDDVPEEFIAHVWAVMHQTPQHTYQVLTKRHARMRSLLSSPYFLDLVQGAVDNLYDDPDDQVLREPWPPSNVWVGVSVETQRWADIRVPALLLLDTPTAVRWLSCEPLLGPLDLRPYLDRLNWVVVGGESGSGYRPVAAEWVRSIRDQCRDAGVPFFFKQWGGRSAKAGGRELDGTTYDEYPQVVPHG